MKGGCCDGIRGYIPDCECIGGTGGAEGGGGAGGANPNLLLSPVSSPSKSSSRLDRMMK